MESFSLANRAKAHPSGVFKAQILATVLATVVAIPLSLVIMYTYGLNGHFTGYAWTASTIQATGSWWHAPGYIPNEGMMFLFIIGALTVVALTTLRSNVGSVFNYFHPAGIWLGLSIGVQYFFPFLVSTIVNIVVLKVAGAKFDEEKIAPFAIGLILGYTVLIIPALLVELWRIPAGI